MPRCVTVSFVSVLNSQPVTRFGPPPLTPPGCNQTASNAPRGNTREDVRAVRLVLLVALGFEPGLRSVRGSFGRSAAGRSIRGATSTGGVGAAGTMAAGGRDGITGGDGAALASLSA